MSEISAIISEIQRFSTGDGPGIRSTAFLKGCNLYCEWCHNPETISPEPQMMFYKHLCKNCGSCKYVVFDKNVCPNEALKLCGLEYTASQTVEILLEDKAFYASSGGGVTFSGGEPLLKPEFLYECCKLLKEHGINIIIDTALNVDYSVIEKINPFTDSYFADLKGVDYNDCYKNTGADLNVVVSNMKRLVKDKKELVIRIPVIPRYSHSKEYMKKAAQIVNDIGASSVNLLPFHNYGSAKYDALGKEYKYKNAKAPTKEQLLELSALFENAIIEF